MASEKAAAVAPPGLTTNFDQNSDLWSGLIAVSVTSLIIMSSAVMGRLYVATIKSRTLRLDDYLCALAVIIMIVWTIVYDIAGHLGVSRHQWNVRSSNIPQIFNLLNICDILYGPMLFAAKSSLLLQIRRRAMGPRVQKNRIKYLIYPTGLVITGYYISCIFQFAFQCVPRKGLWDPKVDARCGNTTALTFGAAAFGLLTNLMLYTNLLWLIYVVGTRSLGGWLALGPIHVVALFGITTSVTTVYYRMPFTDPLGDLTYHIAIVGIWAMAEYAAIIVVGCLPSLGIWFEKKSDVVDEDKGIGPEDASPQWIATSPTVAGASP